MVNQRTMKALFILLLAGIPFGAYCQNLATIDVEVFNFDGKPYSGDKVYFVSQSSKKTFSGITNELGKFKIDLPQGNIFDIKIQSIGDEVEYNTLEIPTIGEDERFQEMVLTITYQAEENYELDNLQFESGKATLKSESYSLLSDLVEIMQLKKSMKIEIVGHTDSDGEAAQNLTLSKQRAESVKNYLISKGISGSRISTNGYGESKPIADNSTAVGKAKNRRTEIRIL